MEYVNEGSVSEDISVGLTDPEIGPGNTASMENVEVSAVNTKLGTSEPGVNEEGEKVVIPEVPLMCDSTKGVRGSEAVEGEHCGTKSSGEAESNLYPETADPLSNKSMDGTFGIRNMFSSTLNDSLLNQSHSFPLNESVINICGAVSELEIKSKGLVLENKPQLEYEQSDANFSDNAVTSSASEDVGSNDPCQEPAILSSNVAIASSESSQDYPIIDSSIGITNLCKSVSDSTLGLSSLYKSVINADESTTVFELPMVVEPKKPSHDTSTDYISDTLSDGNMNKEVSQDDKHSSTSDVPQNLSTSHPTFNNLLLEPVINDEVGSMVSTADNSLNCSKNTLSIDTDGTDNNQVSLNNSLLNTSKGDNGVCNLDLNNTRSDILKPEIGGTKTNKSGAMDEPSLDNSLNSTLGISNLNKSVDADASLGPNSSVVDSTFGEYSLTKSFVSSLNSTTDNLIMSATITFEDSNESPLGSKNIENSMSRNNHALNQSMNSTLGVHYLCKLIDEEKKSGSKNIMDESLKFSILDSTCGDQSLDQSKCSFLEITSENLNLDSTETVDNLYKFTHEINNLNESTLTKDLSLNSTLGISNLYTSVRGEVEVNVSSPLLIKSHIPDSTTFAEHSSIPDPTIENSVMNLTTGVDEFLKSKEDTSCESDVKPLEENVISNASFVAGGDNNCSTEEKQDLCVRSKTSFEKSRIEVGNLCNETKYNIKDLDITNFMTINDHTENLPAKEGGIGVHLNERGMEDMEVTIISQKPVILSCNSNTAQADMDSSSSDMNGSLGEKSFDMPHVLPFIDDCSMDISASNILYCGNNIQTHSIHHPNEINNSNTEMTLLGEETIMLCQSVNQQFDRLSGSDSIPEIPKCPASESYIAGPIPVNDGSIMLSTSADETSMCAMDYSLPLSDCTGRVPSEEFASQQYRKNVSVCFSFSKESTFLNSTINQSLAADGVLKSAKDLAVPNPNETLSLDDSNNSGYLWDSYLLPGHNKSGCGNESSLTFANKTSCVKQLLSESIKSLHADKLSPSKEIISLKENLFLVMDLLEKENSEFETFRKHCENEKLKLLDKIKLLEIQIASTSKEPDHSATDNNAEEVDDLKTKVLQLAEIEARCNASEEKLKQTEIDLEYLKSLIVLTETELPQLDLLISQLNSIGLNTDGIIVEGSRNVLQLKTALNILAAFITKHNAFVVDYNLLSENSKKDKANLDNMNEIMKNSQKKEAELACLRLKCDELTSALRDNENLVSELQSKLLSYDELKETVTKHKMDADIMNENVLKLQEELSQEKKRSTDITTEYGVLEKELAAAIEITQLSQSENVDILNKYEKCKEELLALDGIQGKYCLMEKQLGDVTQKCIDFEKLLGEKIVECEEISKLNGNLQDEVCHLNVLLDRHKKDSEEESFKWKNEFNILKSLFDEKSLSLDQKISELASFKEDNTSISNDLNTANKMLNSLSDNNMILTSEFKSLLLHFEEISLKYKILNDIKSNLTKQYEDALVKVKTLEEQHMLEVESNKTRMDEVTNLNSMISNISEKYSNLQLEYNVALSKVESDSSQLKSLNQELDELKTLYNETKADLTQLQGSYLEKSESENRLQGEVSSLGLLVQEREESLASLKSERDATLSMYETECSRTSQMQQEHLVLGQKYEEALERLESMKKLHSEGEVASEKNLMKVNDLLEEVDKLKRSLSVKNLEFEELLQKYESERVKLTAAEAKASDLLEKCSVSAALIEKLENDCSEKDQTKNKLEQDIMALTLECNVTNENLIKLKTEHDVLVVNLNEEQLKLASLEKEHSDLTKKFEEVVFEKEKFKEDYSESIRNNERSLLDIDNLNAEISKLTESLGILKTENDDILQKLEISSSTVSSLQSDISSLQQQYEETIVVKNNLEKEVQENISIKEKLLEEARLLSEKLSSVTRSHDSLMSEFSELKSHYESKCSELFSISEAKKEFEANYQATLFKLSELERECSMKSGESEKLREDLGSVRSELTALSEKFRLLEAEHGRVLSESSEERAKCQLLEQESGSLSTRYQEALSQLAQLESESLAKSNHNQLQAEELTSLQSEVQSVTSQLSSLKEEYERFTFKYNEESEKRLELQTVCGELEVKYEKSIQCIADLKNKVMEIAERNGVEVKRPDEVQETEVNTAESVKHQRAISGYNTALSSLSLLHEAFSRSREANEKLEIELSSMRNDLDTSKEKLAALCKEYESLKCEYEDRGYKCETLQGQLQDLENKCTDNCSKLEALQKVHSDTSVENEKLLRDNCLLRNEINELKTKVDLLESELKFSNEVGESLVEECNALKTEVSGLNEEKSLRVETEKVNIDLKAKCESLESDLNLNIEKLRDLDAECKSVEAKLNHDNGILQMENDELKKQISELSFKLGELSSEVESMKLTKSLLEADLEQKHSELSSANLKILNYKHYEELIDVFKSDFPMFKKIYIIAEESISPSDNNVFDIFFSCVENIIKEHNQVINECSENKSVLAETQEEVERLTVQVKSLLGSLQKAESQSSDLNSAYLTIQEKYETLNNSYTAIKENHKSLTDQFNALNIENTDNKSLCENLAKQLEENSKTGEDLRALQMKHDLLVSENNKNLTQLSSICKEKEELGSRLSRTENQFSNLKTEIEKHLLEVASLREENSRAKEECSNLSLLYSNMKGNSEKLEIENKNLKMEKLKYEKEYQCSIDSLRKTQEEMCSIEKKCDEKMSRFTFVLKEKENFENKTLSLLKENDELRNQIMLLTVKVHNFEESHGKLLLLESAHSVLLEEKVALEKHVSELDRFRRETTDLKASLAVKDSKMNEIMNEYKLFKTSCHQKFEANQGLIDVVSSLVPGVSSAESAAKALEDKFNLLKTIENELNEEKIKCENLDEECNILNEDLKYKEKVIGDMYKEHADEIETFKHSLEILEKTNKESGSENTLLKEKVNDLEKEIVNMKNSKPSPCTKCIEVKQTLHKTKLDLVDRQNKVTSLQQHLEEFQSGYKRKVSEYRKRISVLQEELSSAKAVGGIDLSKTTSRAVAATQTDSHPLQLTNPSGIIQSGKIKEQEEKIHKMEKEISTLKKVCHNRLVTMKDLQAKLDSKTPVEEGKKPQRNVLSEVQNN